MNVTGEYIVKMLIKKQSKRILAILLAGIMMCNMPYFKPIIAMAEDIEVGGANSTEVVESSTSNNYIFGDPLTSCTLTINEGVELSGNITTGDDASGEILLNNNGTISGNIILTNSTIERFVIYNSGSIANISTTGVDLNLSGGTIGVLSTSEALVTVSSNITVTDSLSLSGGTYIQSGSGSITVSRSTNVSISDNVTVTVTCEGKEFILSGVSGRMDEVCGIKMTITATDIAGLNLVDNSCLSSYYMHDDTISSVQYKLLPGYAITADYISTVKNSCTGAGTLDVTYSEADNILSISYTVAQSDLDIASREVNITLTAPQALSEGTVVFVIPDIYEGQEVTYTFGAATEYDTSTATVKFKKNSEDDSAYTTTKPTAVGDYTALVEFPATYDYGAYSQTYSFSIKNLEDGLAEITVADISYGETLDSQYSSSTNDTTPTVEYKLVSEDESAYTTTVPTAVGSYNARVTYPATSSHTQAVATTTFEINYLQGNGSISVDDVYVGTEVNPVYSSTKNGTAHVIIEYKLTSDTEYTTVKPTAVGSYEVRATFPATLIYDEFVATDTFEIKVLEEGEGFVNIEDVYVGTGITTTYGSDTNPVTPLIEYKSISADDSEYSTSVPTDIGEYIVRATYEKNSTYDTLVVTDIFKIKDLEVGFAAITADDVIFGLLVSPTFWTSTNQGAKVTILYKEASADDSTYTTTVPSQVGTYTVKAVFEAYGIYKEVVVTDNFTISYLELPEQPYTLSGTLGENDIYTSVVEIIPIEGYLISDTLGGNYKESLTYDKTTFGSYIYFKKAETGEMSAGVPLKDFKVDIKAPSINLENEKVYYGDALDINLTDKDISHVVINGKTYTVEDLSKLDNKLTLDSEGGVTEYTIQIWDMAGNMTEITITVASEWTKSGIIPVGNEVKLTADKAYILGEGNWQVEGDNTSYSGNITFYVSEDGNYTFTQE